MTDSEFRPTHVAPAGGLPAWTAPGVSHPSDRLDPLLPVQLVESRGDWSRIICSNGWSAWVDGRMLVSVPHGPPGTARPLARTADPRPLLAEIEHALGRYRRLVEELAAGSVDRENFRRRAQSLRVGVIVDGESAWLLDQEGDRWCYCDGTGLQTFAAIDEPSSGTGPGSGSGSAEQPPRTIADQSTRTGDT